MAADLDRPTVLALRLYTTSAFRSINKPLRDGRKHPYPVLVSHIVNGITKLRCEAAKKEDQRTAEYYRGLCIDPNDEFFSRGCTELSFFSCMHVDRKVAERTVSMEGANASILLKLNLTPEQAGADISFLSCFPSECEHLFAPGTYVEPKAERGGARLPGAVKLIEGHIHVKEHPLIIPRTEEPEPLIVGAAVGGTQPLKPSRMRQIAGGIRGAPRDPAKFDGGSSETLGYIPAISASAATATNGEGGNPG